MSFLSRIFMFYNNLPVLLFITFNNKLGGRISAVVSDTCGRKKCFIVR